MTIFVDTSAFLAVINEDDPNHFRADQLWQQLLSQHERLVTTNYIVVETIALLQRRFSLLAVKKFQEDVIPLLEIIWIDETTHAVALQSLFAANQHHLSLVDCVSFITMFKLKISTAFVFDMHFQQQGITCLT